MNLFTSNSKTFVVAFLAIFTAGMMVFAIGSELIIRYTALPHDGFQVHIKQFRAATTPTAAFGDSHVAGGIESSDQIANLGYAGETLPMMLAKAEAYVNSGRGARIILQLSPQQFAIYRVDRRQDELAGEFFGHAEPWLEFLRPQFRSYLLAYWSAVIKDTLQMTSSAKPAPSTTQIDRVNYIDLAAEERRKASEIRVQLHAPLPGGPVVEQLLAEISRTLDRFRALGIQTCLVEYPVSSDYRAAAEKVDTFESLRTRFRALAASKGITLVALAASMPDHAFGDPDHVAFPYRRRVTDLVLQECFKQSDVGAPPKITQPEMHSPSSSR